jgi:hypothetical protein
MTPLSWFRQKRQVRGRFYGTPYDSAVISLLSGGAIRTVRLRRSVAPG